MSVERLCRVGNDFANLKEVILTAIRLCRKVDDWTQLNTTLTLLSKRRGQHGKTVTAMVQEVGLFFFVFTAGAAPGVAAAAVVGFCLTALPGKTPPFPCRFRQLNWAQLTARRNNEGWC